MIKSELHGDMQELGAMHNSTNTLILRVGVTSRTVENKWSITQVMQKLPLSGRCKIWLYAGITEYLLVLVTRQRVAVKI
jgi:hypothetical protein